MTKSETFIEKSVKKFNNRYDYSLVDYINIKTKIILKCNKHGLIFSYCPKTHLDGISGGCLECIKDHKAVVAKQSTSTLSDFISKAEKVHKNLYEYSKFTYTSAKIKSTVVCKIHGDFEINPNNHLNGKGCNKCSKITGGKSKTNTAASVFILKAKNRHQNIYTYQNFKYIKAKIRSNITCKIHGDFLCSPDNHLRGKGCPACAKTVVKFINLETFKNYCVKNLKGYGILYILNFTDLRTNDQFLKVGVTSNSIEKRYPKYVYKNFSYKIVYTTELPAEIIFKSEQKIHKKFYKYKAEINKDFAGYSECYTLNLPIDEVVNSILPVLNTHQT